MERLPRQPDGGLKRWLRGWVRQSDREPEVLARKADRVVSLHPSTLDGWSQPDLAGVCVGEGSVLALSAAWACINLIAGTIASLPLMVYRDVNGRREVARDHPLYRVLHDSPNYDQTALDFWEGGQAALELRGNMHARVERIGGRIVALHPIHDPSVVRAPNGALRYRWTEDGRAWDLAQEEVLHIRGFGGSPLGGMSTLSHGRQVFGLAQATNNTASATFANGVRPSMAMITDRVLGTERDRIEQALADKHQGAMNSGRPMLLEAGIKPHNLSFSPEDAQMLETRGFNVEEVCRLFGVPPHMIGHTAGNTHLGSSIEEQTLGFQKYTLRRRLKRIEQAIQKQLLTPADRVAGVAVEFNLEGLLRADSKGRSEFYQRMTQIGAMTINEVRALENLPPVQGGDKPRMQMQNVPITQAGKAPAVTA